MYSAAARPGLVEAPQVAHVVPRLSQPRRKDRLADLRTAQKPGWGGAAPGEEDQGFGVSPSQALNSETARFSEE